MKKHFHIIFFLACLLIFVGTLFWVNKPQTIIKAVPTPTSLPTLAPLRNLDVWKIYNLINDYRASKGLNKLVFDPSMCDYAKKRLHEIHTDWSHNGFSVNATYSGEWIGENLIKGFRTEEETVDAWLKSPTHLEQIVKPVYSRTCIETDIYEETNFTVQQFASY